MDAKDATDLTKAIAVFKDTETFRTCDKFLSSCLGIVVPYVALGEEVSKNLAKGLEKYAKKIKALPSDSLIEPPPEIGSKVLQQMLYTPSNERLESLAEILKKASSIKEKLNVYPSLLNIFDSLLSEEISYLRDISYSKSKTIPFVRIVFETTVFDTLFYLNKVETNLNLDVVHPNLIRLGLLALNENIQGGIWDIGDQPKFEKFSTSLLDDKSFRENVVTQIKKENGGEEITIKSKLDCNRGYYKVTPLADAFLEMIDSNKVNI